MAEVVRIDQITTLDWQPKRGEVGTVVRDLDDIGQCIMTILQTPVGSSPLRPLFGSNLLPYLDAPQLLAADLVREATEALQLWEPRLQVNQVLPELAADGSLSLTVIWTPVDQADADTQQTVVSL